MVQVGDLAEKTVILLGVCLGLRSGDFSSLKRKPIIEAYKDSGEDNDAFMLTAEVNW